MSRSEHTSKYTFARHGVFGEEPNLEIMAAAILAYTSMTLVCYGECVAAKRASDWGSHGHGMCLSGARLFRIPMAKRCI